MSPVHISVKCCRCGKIIELEVHEEDAGDLQASDDLICGSCYNSGKKHVSFDVSSEDHDIVESY
jgi:hypothetical protein